MSPKGGAKVGIKKAPLKRDAKTLRILLKLCEFCDYSTTTPKFFCVSPKFSEQNIRDRIAAELNQSTTKIDFCRALYRLQHIGCIDIDQYSSDDRRAKALNDYQSTYKLSASDFCKARATRWTQNDAEFSQS